MLQNILADAPLASRVTMLKMVGRAEKEPSQDSKLQIKNLNNRILESWVFAIYSEKNVTFFIVQHLLNLSLYLRVKTT